MYIIISRDLIGLSKLYPVNLNRDAISFKLIKRLKKRPTVILLTNADVVKLERFRNKSITEILCGYREIKVYNKHYITLSQMR